MRIIKSASLALVAHCLILALPNVVAIKTPEITIVPLTVTLQQEVAAVPNQLQKNIHNQQRTPPTVFRADPTKPEREAEHAPTPKTRTVISALAIRDFAEVSSRDYFKSNAAVLDQLQASFSDTRQLISQVEITSLAAQAQLFQTGVGKTISKNGEHTCVAVIYDLQSNQALGDQLVYQDCTPKKPLDLSAR